MLHITRNLLVNEYSVLIYDTTLSFMPFDNLQVSFS